MSECIWFPKAYTKWAQKSLPSWLSHIVWTEEDKIKSHCSLLSIEYDSGICDTQHIWQGWKWIQNFCLCKWLKCQLILTWSIYWFRSQFYLQLNVKVNIVLVLTLWIVHFHFWLSQFNTRKCRLVKSFGMTAISYASEIDPLYLHWVELIKMKVYNAHLRRGITFACNHKDNNGENLWEVIIDLSLFLETSICMT